MPTREALQLMERYNRAIAGLEDATVDRLHTAMDKAYRDLERELRTTYPAIASNDTLLATQRKVLILEQLGETLQVVRPDQAAAYQQSLQEALQTANQTGRTLADELVQAIEPGSAIPSLANVPIEATALQARDGLERLRRHSEEFRGKAIAVIEQGLIQGWGPAKVADLLRSELQTTKSKAETIARTEILSALNDAAQQRYAENGIEGVQWICTIGGRSDVCKYCVARNTQVYPTGKVRVPAHPRCRCVLLPWRPSWQKKGLTDDAFIKNYQDGRLKDLEKLGGKVDKGITPFEKASGLKEPPKPLWTIGAGLDRTLLPAPIAALDPIFLQPQNFNPNAIPSLSVKEFREMSLAEERLAYFASPNEAWNLSYADWTKGKFRPSRKQYETDLRTAIANGVPVPDRAISDLKLNKQLLKQLEANRAEAVLLQRKAERLQRAINHPLLTEAEAKGWKPLMSAQESQTYTRNSFMGDLSFYHGNLNKVALNIASEGAKPELNTRGIYGQGAYFAASKRVGEDYAGWAIKAGQNKLEDVDASVISIRAKVKNPYIATHEQLTALGANFAGEQDNGVDASKMTRFLKAKGYDSIYMPDNNYFVAFDGRQVVTYEIDQIAAKSDRGRSLINNLIMDTNEMKEIGKKSNTSKALQGVKSSEKGLYQREEEEDDFS